jgi:LacI family transcriptional regulator
MHNPTRRPTQVMVKPRPQVIARESTDIVFADSRPIGQALRYVREHATSGMNVNDLLKRVPISRRALERGFLRNVGRTGHEEILRMRLARAKSLLASTDLKLPDVAERSGFSSAALMCNVFRRDVKTTPAQFRRSARSGGDQ